MNGNNSMNAAAGSALGGTTFLYFIILVLILASMWRIFTKAGKPGWAALIPIYNVVLLLEIVGRPIWWFLLLLIPGVNLVCGIIVTNDLSKSFGKDVGFTVGLFFLPFIFYPMLAFGDATYQGPAAGPAASNLISSSSVATKQE